ncbi:hypothetical protein GON26_17810 [Flavobacterium sp. GA093]|uniref:Lipocalin-like domain-containing protein n=1 Tax=Flavobacterium hydrocarbonoxydans TaxID=2683249 RepID=A0A6I4NT43_9FLAO|nr:hypothetical protein [Flavobacterium hydrocarbonoxydans]MWB96222.1 hypothetical protein [Flavobacterium hydrocarbonoxydans]
MKNIKYLLLILTSLFILNSCSNDSDEQNCPENEIATMKINGEEKQFVVSGWGINLDNDGTGHTLDIQLTVGVFSPQQDSYSVTLKMPYKKVGDNIMEEINYLRVEGTTSTEGDFLQSELQSKVTVNKNNCISATFSGTAILEGNEVTISDGNLQHIYAEPF